MRITQGTFSFLPDFTDEQIEAQIRLAVTNGWSLVDRVHRRPAPAERLLGDVGPAALRPDGGRTSRPDARGSRRAARPSRRHYIKVIAYDPTRGRQTTRARFIVNRPSVEHGFELERTRIRDRVIRYRMVHKRDGSRRPSSRAMRPMRGAGPATNGRVSGHSFAFGMVRNAAGGSREEPPATAPRGGGRGRAPARRRGRPRGGARRDERRRGARPARPRADRARARSRRASARSRRCC